MINTFDSALNFDSTLNNVSIVIPILNESESLSRLLAHLAQLQPLPQQVILVDGGSTDDSVMLAKQTIKRLTSANKLVLNWQIVESTAGRAAQMNAGAALATGEVLLFLHADTLLPRDAIAQVVAATKTAQWGRFDVRLDSDQPMLKLVSTMINLRSRLSAIATGDQAIFITRALFEQLGGYPEQPLMEDVELCKRLKGVAKPACLNSKVTTSARRWQQHGTWRTIGLMWQLRFDYWRGVSADNIKARYYKS